VCSSDLVPVSAQTFTAQRTFSHHCSDSSISSFMMLSRAVSSLRSRAVQASRRPFQESRRNMGGHGHPPYYISPIHTFAGEAMGVICWLWILHRARVDGPVVLGYRLPWEHADDPWAPPNHGEDEHAMESQWDGFYEKSTRPGEDDEDDDEEEGEDEDDDDDE